MKLTILGSGGCMVIPKPLCYCRICREARQKGIPYSRGGPAAFLHDSNLLIDTPAEIAAQLNREHIRHIHYLMLTHLDPDHVEGMRVVEQIVLDFRTWRSYPEKRITLLLPEQLETPLHHIATQYGPAILHYTESGFLEVVTFRERVRAGDVSITAIPVERNRQKAFVYVYEKEGKKLVYAPCDIKPFPEKRYEVKDADVLVIQPGIFETGLQHGFCYPADHVSRKTLYTFEQTLALASRIRAKQTVFVHLEEYWHRSHDDYLQLEKEHDGIRFAYDGIKAFL
jgi:phosphoribosyl 1,2-cyclic phosphate phosphodiesterase